MGQNSIISSFFARRAKKASAEGRSPPQELEKSPHSGLYLLVVYEMAKLRSKCFLHWKKKVGQNWLWCFDGLFNLRDHVWRSWQEGRGLSICSEDIFVDLY